MNPFFQQNTQMNFGPFQNMTQMMQQFQQFKNTFQGDPQQKVQELLNSGRMTQQQFNQLSQMANMFRGMFH